MIMDLVVLGIVVLTILICSFRGFLLTLLGFFKGIVSWIIAWFFCDDLALLFIEKTKVGEVVTEKINGLITTKIETAGIGNILPESLIGDNSIFSSDLVNNGSIKIAQVLITVTCFLLIGILLTAFIGIFTGLLKRRDRKSTLSKFDRTVGIFLGIVLGVVYAYVFLALLVPVLSLIIPNQADTVMSWFDGSIVSRAMYDNNLFILLIKELVKKF